MVTTMTDMTTTATEQASWIPRDSMANRLVLARRHYAKAHGLSTFSQRSAAELCGLTFGEWQGLEDDRAVGRETEKAQKIAHGLGVDLPWLLLGGYLDRRNPARTDTWTGGDRRRKGYPGYRGQNASKVTPLFSVLGTFHPKAA